jgi:hypothetical protein
LTFWYVWVNPNETFALINAAGVLAVNGFCLIGSDGGTFAGNRQSALTIDANLVLPSAAAPLSQPLHVKDPFLSGARTFILLRFARVHP